MNLVSIAIILSATVANNVQASEAVHGVTPGAAQSALLDHKAELKISPRIVSLVPNYYPALQVCSKDGKANSCDAAFETFRRGFLDKSNAEIAKLDKQIKAIEVLCRESNESVCHGVSAGAFEAIKSDKSDLEAVNDTISAMQKLRGTTGYGKRSVDAMMANLKDVIIKQYKAINFGTHSINGAFNSNSQSTAFVKNFKSWLMAVKLYTDTAAAQMDINPKEFDEKDFKLELAKINVPVGRFSVIPIDSSMNIEALRIQNPNADAVAIAAILKTNYKTFKRRYADTSVKSELSILDKVIPMLFAEIDESAHDQTVTFDLYKDRLTVLERAAEGIIGSLNAGKLIATETITKYVKMWMYAKQIVEAEGSTKVLFGLSQLPAPVVAPPVKEVETTRPRTDSNASTTSTSSTSSKNSIFSVFGF